MLAPADRPTRPESMSVDYYEEPDALAIHKKRGGGAPGLLTLWFLGWSVACVAIGVAVVNKPSLATVAFALPFWSAWFLVGGLLVWMYFGKETILVRRDKAFYHKKAWITLSSRVIPREEIQGFREYRSSYTENGRHVWSIEMVTRGAPLRFASRLPDQERVWLIDQLNRFLGTSPPEPDYSEPSPTFAAGDASRSLSAETLTRENTLDEPATDSTWALVNNISSLSFEQRGRFSLSTVGVMLFLNLFWNGIVSVFVLVLFGFMPDAKPPEGLAWVGMFVFLLPFELIGLAFFLGLFFSILEPVRRTEILLEHDHIAKRTCYPLYCHTKRWDVRQLSRLELRRHSRLAAERERRHGKTARRTPVPNQFDLAFVLPENADLCTLGPISEHEARWMGHVILERRYWWFGE